MTDFIHDTFTGADGATLGSHTGETGASWSYVAGWGSYDNKFEIRNNRLMLVADAGSLDELYTVSGSIVGSAWAIEIGFIVDGTDYQYIKLLAGTTVYGDDYPLIDIRSDPGTSRVRFSGGYAIFTPPSSAFVTGQQYVAKVVAVGQALSYYVDGALIGTHTAANSQTPTVSVNQGRGASSTPTLGATYLRAYSTGPAAPFWTANILATET